MDFPYAAMLAAQLAAMLCMLWRWQLRKRPALFVFLAVSFGLAIRGVGASRSAYIGLYVQSEIGVSLFMLMVGVELYRQTLARYPGVGLAGRVFGAVSLAIALVVGISAVEPGMRINWSMGVMQAAFLGRIAVSSMVAAFSALLILATGLFPNQFSRNYCRYRMCVCGYCVATVSLYLASLMHIATPATVYLAMCLASIGLSGFVAVMGNAGERIPVHSPRLSPEEINRRRGERSELMDALKRWRLRSAERLNSKSLEPTP